MKLGIASACFALALGEVAFAQGQPDVEILPSPPKEVGFDQNIGRHVPLDVTFKDETGRTIRFGDAFADGKPVVLSLAYYTCPMLCGLSMNGLASSLKGINLDAGKDFNVVTLSFDPRETPEMARAKKEESLARYGRVVSAARESGAGFGGPRTPWGWRFLTGDEASIKRVTSAVGFRYVWDAAAKQYAHATGVVVLTPDGKIARYLFGIEYAPKDLRLSLVEASKGQLGTVVDSLLLLCYHYDPRVGKYGPVAVGAMRIAGGATVLCIGAFIVVMARRERKRNAGGGRS